MLTSLLPAPCSLLLLPARYNVIHSMIHAHRWSNDTCSSTNLSTVLTVLIVFVS